MSFVERGKRDQFVDRIVNAENGEWWTLMHRCNMCNRWVLVLMLLLLLLLLTVIPQGFLGVTRCYHL